MNIKNNKKGSALYLTMITGVIIIFTSVASLTLTNYEQQFTYQQSDILQARYVSEAGSARATQYITLNYLGNNKLDFTDIDDNLDNVTLFEKEAFMVGDTKLGEYSVSTRILTSTDISSPKDMSGNDSTSVRFVLVECIGYTPDADNPKSAIAMSTVYEIGTDVAQVFDYSYFINNWGWWYANSITCNGNSRTNGSFDLGPYHPKVYGKPRFESSNGTDLIGYIDDNGDGKQNNQDGGIFAWDTITGTPATNAGPADLYQGLKGANPNFDVSQVPMPNLTNLNAYEEKAKTKGSIKIDGVEICDGVWGDDEGKQNLYLEGTYDKPIVIEGTVVVRGDLIIRGYVTGQAAIFCGRNIYLPQRLLYKNSVSNKQPSNNSEASRENWRETNNNADLIGLFAREHIVISDYTGYWWQRYVSGWVNNSLNKSKEDAGLDQIPNTGDEGEDDGVWSVVLDGEGNPIPGTGEDIDGDGVFDDTTQMSEFSVSSGSFYTGHSEWGGNIPDGVSNFNDISYWNDNDDEPGVGSGSQNIPQVNGFLYTNHFLGGYFSNSGGYNYKNDNRGHFNHDNSVVFFGSVISRNESLIYNASELVFYHDDRLSADGGKTFDFEMPQVWRDLSKVAVEFRQVYP